MTLRPDGSRVGDWSGQRVPDRQEFGEHAADRLHLARKPRERPQVRQPSLFTFHPLRPRVHGSWVQASWVACSVLTGQAAEVRGCVLDA
eukprot:1028315-Rhodomonas_salina.1